jgi:hypothetical protein
MGNKSISISDIILFKRGEHGMEDDLNKLINLKEPPFQPPKDVVKIKQTTSRKPSTRMCFIITKNKSNSWIDDLHAQEQLNQMERVYH